jgi:drug/metabolite transporter (DMT)-like permease
VLFASRDSLIRRLSIDTDIDAAVAAAATLGSGSLVILLSLVAARRPPSLRPLVAVLPTGLTYGLSYVLLFEAFYRGRVSVVSPLVATESLWTVVLALVFLRRHEHVGVRLVAGALLVVAGGVLIGVFR